MVYLGIGGYYRLHGADILANKLLLHIQSGEMCGEVSQLLQGNGLHQRRFANTIAPTCVPIGRE